ncbi:unnamed protein product [Periconia digitata]|uniref:Uncharacterized protein n=1 Tax=Periconia digitata TaxID=1303443 RepID=A0A9W4U9E1_9PLEO|nr:unnamed protein product [Periconia digitata]
MIGSYNSVGLIAPTALFNSALPSSCSSVNKSLKQGCKSFMSWVRSIDSVFTSKTKAVVSHRQAFARVKGSAAKGARAATTVGIGENGGGPR